MIFFSLFCGLHGKVQRRTVAASTSCREGVIGDVTLQCARGTVRHCGTYLPMHRTKSHLSPVDIKAASGPASVSNKPLRATRNPEPGAAT